jgi:hypothetical protein
MKNSSLEKIADHLSALFIASVTIGLIGLFLIQMIFLLPLSTYTYIGWVILCTVFYAVANHIKNKNTTQFDFYKVAEPLERKARRKKKNIEERVAIHIDEDGLDPMILFDEAKSGVSYILKLSAISHEHKLQDYLSELYVLSEQQGSPIAGQTLMEVHYQGESGYYRLTSSGLSESIDFAFPENSRLLYEQILVAVKKLRSDYPELSITKVNVINYQTMAKFYHYVQRLKAPENRSLEYISYCEGTVKICNTSYIELYDCNLQTILTSWMNKDGIIRSDNVDIDVSENSVLELMDIELPYPECRLADIQIVKMEDTQKAVKLYLTFLELVDGEPTAEVSSLSLLMAGNSISIKRDEESDQELISVADYFKRKSYTEL